MARILTSVAQRECRVSDRAVHFFFDLNTNGEVDPPLLLFQYVASFSDKLDARHFVLGMRVDAHNFYMIFQRHSMLTAAEAWFILVAKESRGCIALVPKSTSLTTVWRKKRSMSLVWIEHFVVLVVRSTKAIFRNNTSAECGPGMFWIYFSRQVTDKLHGSFSISFGIRASCSSTSRSSQSLPRLESFDNICCYTHSSLSFLCGFCVPWVAWHAPDSPDSYSLLLFPILQNEYLTLAFANLFPLGSVSSFLCAQLHNCLRVATSSDMQIIPTDDSVLSEICFWLHCRRL